MRSLTKSARGIKSPFPVMASSIEKDDKPLMLSGFKKFVHCKSENSCQITNQFAILYIHKCIKFTSMICSTICATGIHMKRSVAVHPDTDPTNLVAFSGSLPIRACKYMV